MFTRLPDNKNFQDSRVHKKLLPGINTTIAFLLAGNAWFYCLIVNNNISIDNRIRISNKATTLHISARAGCS